MFNKNLKNKKILIMGLGLIGGGYDTVKWLAKQGALITITDLKSKKELEPTIKKLKKIPLKFILGRHRFNDFIKTDLIIKNPAVRNNSPYLKKAKKMNIPIETDIGLFFHFWPNKIIGVTGAKGKSTTSSLIYKIFKNANKKANLAGNIGESPLKFLSKTIQKNTVMILELSSFQLENLNTGPQISVITNIYPDHLDRYKNLASYIKAKKRIFTKQNKNDYLILNYDNEILRRISKQAKSNIYWFSIKHKVNQGVFIEKNNIIFKSNELNDKKTKKICTIQDIRIKGNHNLENVLAAITVSCLNKINPKIIIKTLKKFRGIKNRLEPIANIKGVQFINDTAATTPEATIAALKTLGKGHNLVLIGGGSDKKLHFSNLVKYIKKYSKSIILLPGKASAKIESALHKIKYFKIDRAISMSQAIKKAKKIAKKGDIVLLSPASASFGLFKNEFDRGNQFKKYVK